jgi:hypothetical protein
MKLACWDFFVEETKNHTQLLESWAQWSTFLATSLHHVDRCCWHAGSAPLLVVSGALHGWDDERAEAPSAPHIILGAGSEPSLQFSFMV